MTFGLTLWKEIKKNQNEIAISFGEKKVKYGLLNDLSIKIASIIETYNSDNIVIGILGQRNFSVYFGILGAVYSGCTYVPINDKYTEDKIFTIIKESKISILIGNEQSISNIEKFLDRTTIKAIILPEKNISDLRKNISNKIKIYYEQDILKQKEITPREVNNSDVFYILFTSGSTGDPKGVMVTNSNIKSFINNFREYFDLKIGYKASQTFDLGFDLSVVDIFLTWINGGQICILKNSELLLPYEYLKREKINFWFSVPTLANFMLKMGYLTPNSFPELKYSLFCGEPLTKELADAWQLAAPNCLVENYYGPTEATVSITRFLYKKEFKNRKFNNNILPIGYIFDKHSFAIIDQNSKKLDDGKKGHLIIKGKQISKGYLNDPKKTNNSFRKFDWDKSNETWYLTGDRAFVNKFSEIECLGRLDDQIKIAGRRIELGEIESALRYSNIIEEIVVVPKKDKNGLVNSIVAFITKKISEKEKILINEMASKYIEKLFLPKEYIFIENFPVTNNGKTDRKILIERVRIS